MSSIMSTRAAFRICLALIYGAVCHGLFGLAVLVMAASLYTGLQYSFGPFASPWSVFTNTLLLAQFPLLHSFLLTAQGQRWLSALGPGRAGKTLSTTSYAIIASIQLLLLFLFWSPSGRILWQAEGAVFWLMTGAFLLSFALLGKSTWDAGIELQSGALGWMALLRDKAPTFPDMPQTGLFKLIRQPIYLSFALTLWTPPVWTADQLAVAATYTAYCYFAPRRKEKRFAELFGARWQAYKARHGYWLPIKKASREKPVSE